MARKRKGARGAKALPLEDRTWAVGIRRLKTRVLVREEELVRPYAMLVVEEDHGFVLGMDVRIKFPTPRQVHTWLLKTMRQLPASVPITPHRPRKITFEQPELARAMAQGLKKLGIEVAEASQGSLLDQAFESLDASLREGGDEPPGLLSVEGVTPELVADLFKAAADMYRAAPWVWFDDSMIVGIRIQNGQGPWFVQFMGHAGMEYGFLLYQDWDELVEASVQSTAWDPRVPASGWHSLSYEPMDSLPFEDQDGIDAYGWEIADSSACPFPVVFTEDGGHRPPREELILYEAIMRSVVVMLQEGLARDEGGGYKPIELTAIVPTHDGPVQVQVTFPAREIPPERMPFGLGGKEPQGPDDVDGEARGIPFDRRAMEKALAGLADVFGEEEDTSPLRAAQEIMYQAWAEPSVAKRIDMAKRALEVCPDCADAYVLLAEEEAGTVAEAMAYFQAGMEAGERALGKEKFQKDAGHFWGLLETRPYMRARAGLAHCLWMAGRVEEAAGHYEELLRLNPGDNQGIRYTLMELYLERGRYQDAWRLLELYGEDPTAGWLYIRALLTFQREGPSAAAERALSEAMDSNPFVPEYLLRIRRLPREQPRLIGFGDEGEAIAYVGTHLNFWYQIPGAAGWLREAWDAR